MISKLCSGCKTEKTLAQFYRNIGNKDGHSYKCKMCKDVQAKVYRENNREKVAAMKAAQQVRYMDKLRDSYYQKAYGISLDDFNQLFKEQKGGCAICSTTDYYSRMQYAKLIVDHCHKTGKVRGLLCKSCNIGLGEFKDDVSLLDNAIGYLIG